MTYNTKIKDLLALQENQIKAFEIHRAEMLEAVNVTEREILRQYGCSYENAPAEVWRIINVMREDYYSYWSNEGRLITELMRRQMRNLEKTIGQIRHP